MDTRWREAQLRRKRAKWLKMYDGSLPLAYTVSVLNRMARDLDESLSDPYTVGSDCGGLIVKNHLRRMEERANKLGYPSLEYVRLHAEMRTSAGWAYKNLAF